MWAAKTKHLKQWVELSFKEMKAVEMSVKLCRIKATEISVEVEEPEIGVCQ